MSPQDRPLRPAETPIVTLCAVSRPGRCKAEECGPTLTTLGLGVRFGVSKKDISCFLILGLCCYHPYLVTFSLYSVPESRTRDNADLPWIISPCDHPLNRKRGPFFVLPYPRRVFLLMLKLCISQCCCTEGPVTVTPN